MKGYHLTFLAWVAIAVNIGVRPASANSELEEKWMLVTVIRGQVESHNGTRPDADWLLIWKALLMREEDSIRTRDDSRASVTTADCRTLIVGANTMLELRRCHVTPLQMHMYRLKTTTGKIHTAIKKFLNGDSSFEVHTTKAVLATRGTTFIASSAQRIAFVQGNDLWVMNDDGSSRTNLLAAPSGGQIGRCAFSPDGSRMVYEVWHKTGDEPQTIDLWTAAADGSGPALLLSAGSLGDDCGKTGLRYLHRLCMGPSISPDGQSVSFLRVQDYQSVSDTYLNYREKEVCRMPLSGGTVTSLYKTMERPGWYSYYMCGEPTQWCPDGQIYFERSGANGARFSMICDATDTNRTTWPATMYMEYNTESGLSANQLSLTVGGQTYEFSGAFIGFGNQVAKTSGWTWTPHPAEWGTSQMGAWYGPLTVTLSAANSASLNARDGQGYVNNAPLWFQVYKGSTNVINKYGVDEAHGFPGLWSVSENGGTPSQALSEDLDSFTVDSSVSRVVAEGEYIPDGEALTSTYAAHFDRQGNERYVDLGQFSWSSAGNWNDTETRVVLWAGASSTAGEILALDPDTGDLLDLGSGRFPMYAPLYHTQVSVLEGTVAMTDTNYQNEVLVSAGQTAVADDLVTHGLPQPAQSIQGPYVTNTIPPVGSLVPATGSVAVVFQFTQPVATNSLNGQMLYGVSWPLAEPAGSQPDALIEATTEAAYTQEGSGRSFQMAMSNLVSSGAGTFRWNAGRTELTIVLTNRSSFPLAGDNRVRASLELGGVSNDTGRVLSFSQAETTFQMIDLPGTNGASLRSAAIGTSLSIPAGALSKATAIGLAGASDVPSGTGSPLASNWGNAGGVVVVSPTGTVLAVAATLVLPVKEGTPGAAIWAFDGTSWTNIGGAYDPVTETISTGIRRLGTFGVFYPQGAGASLVLTKGASTTAAATNQAVQFAMRVWNGGRAAATNTTITDVLPAGLNYETNSAEPPAVWAPATRTLSWNVGVLPPGESRTVMMSASTAASLASGAAVTNTATAVADFTPATNSNPAVVQIGPPVTAVRRLGAGSTNSTAVAQIGALGVGYRRAILSITTAQTQNTNLLDFADFDAQVRANQTNGLRTYGVVNARPTTNQWPAAPAFAAAFRACVERYNGDGVGDMPGLVQPVHEWEVFDAFTPGSNQWAGCTLDMYDSYLVLAGAVAHATDPAATILPSAVDGAPAGTTNYLQQLLASDPGVLDAIDAVSVHDHREGTSCAPAGGLPAIQYLEARSLAEMAAGIDRPVWLTAADFTATYQDMLASRGTPCTEAEQAQFLARAVPFALAAGIDRVFYNEVNCSPSDPPARQWAALITTNGNRRMAYYTLQKLAGLFDACTWTRLQSPATTTIAVELLTTNLQTARIVWDVSNRLQAVTLPIGPVSQARVTSLLPKTWDNTTAVWDVRTNTVTGGMLTLSVSGTPVCVEAVGYVDPDLDGDGILNPLDADADADGMPDAWEASHGLNPFVNDALLDPDNDGLCNLDEYLCGTDPQQSASTLGLEAMQNNDTDVCLQWASSPGQIYRVAWSRALGGGWSNTLDGALCATGTVTTWHDAGPPRTPTHPRTETNRFYRVLLEPAQNRNFINAATAQGL